MSDVYVYAPDADDFTTLGLVGALAPESCEFEELENGLSEITLVHPIDEAGRHKAILPERILRTEVPVRTTPEIEDGSYVTSVQTWTVKSSASKTERTVFTKASGGKKRKVLSKGTKVTVVKARATGRWKIKASKTTGWIDPDALEDAVEETLPDTAAGIERAVPAWVCRDQLFRIYSVEKTETTVTAQARHITYDLLYNITHVDEDGNISLRSALEKVLGQCQIEHDFEVYTDFDDSSTRAGAHYLEVDPITAILDPDDGLAAKYSAEVVRDDYEIYVLAEAGLDRGVRIEYAKNLLGVDMTTDYDSVASYVLPVGQTKSGKPLYLTDGVGPDNRLLRSPQHYSDYTVPRVHVLQCEGCTVGTDGNAATVRAKMREQGLKLFTEDGIDQPDISVSVDFLRLGDTVEYQQYAALENVYLYDEVTVYHPILGIDLKAKVTRVTWDCLTDRMTSMELGTQKDLVPPVKTWQLPTNINGARLLIGSITSWQLSDQSVIVEKLADNAITKAKMDADVVADIEAGAAAGETAQAAQEAAETAQQIAYEAKADVDAAIDVQPDGIYIYDRAQANPATRALVAPDGFRVLDPDGTVSASLGPRVQTLGTLIIRQTSDGGHAFYNTAQA